MGGAERGVAGGAVAFHWSRWKLWRIELLLVLIAGLGVPLVAIDDLETRLLGGLWIGLFGWTLWFLDSRSRSPGPVITVDAGGLLDRRASPEPWRWEEISQVNRVEIEHQSVVGVEFHDARRALSRARWLIRVFAPLHRFLRFPSVTISMALLDGSVDDLLDAIAKFQPTRRLA